MDEREAWLMYEEAWFNTQRGFKGTGVGHLYKQWVEASFYATKAKHGDPVVEAGQEVLIYPNCYCIRRSLDYNDEFPNSPLPVPQVGELATIYCDIHPPLDTVVIVGDGWSTWHVPYAEAQMMRQAYLEATSTP